MTEEDQNLREKDNHENMLTWKLHQRLINNKKCCWGIPKVVCNWSINNMGWTARALIWGCFTTNILGKSLEVCNNLKKYFLFSSLLYCTKQYRNLHKIHVHWLFVLSVGINRICGDLKVIYRFPIALGVNAPNPHVVRGQLYLKWIERYISWRKEL